MKLHIKAKGQHPAQDGWEITDENGVPVMIKGFDLHADHANYTLKVDLEYPELDLELDAEVGCRRVAHYIVEREDKKIALCHGHMNALRLLIDRGLVTSCLIEALEYEPKQGVHHCMEEL